jgi:hypothetical protein
LCVPRFSRDDRRLSGAVQNGKLGTWQVGDSREYRTLVHRDLPAGHGYSSVAVDPAGRLLAISTTNGFSLWDIVSGSELVFVPTGFHNNGVLFEPSGALLVLSSTGLFRWPIPKDMATAGGPIGPPERLPLACGEGLGQSSDGRVIVTSSRAVSVEQPYAGGWILHTDRPGPPLRLDAGVDIGFITVSPDGKWVVTGAHPGGVAKVWDAQDGKLVRQLAERMQYPQFSPDGRWLSTSLDGGRLMSVGSWEMGPKTGPGSGVFSPDSKLLAVPTPVGIHLIDHATGREIALLDDPNFDPASIAFTPDGTRLIALATSGAHVWDLRLMRRRLKELRLDWNWPEFAEDAGNVHAPPASVPPVSDIIDDAALVARMRKCQAARDVAGCRATAVLWEKAHGPGDVASLYNAACMRAITAGATRAADESGLAAKEADAEADRAMAWLKQAVAAGWNDVAHMNQALLDRLQDADLDSLRDRDDFKGLVHDLKEKHSKQLKK